MLSYLKKIILQPLACCSFVLYWCPCRPNSVCAQLCMMLCASSRVSGGPQSLALIFLGLQAEKFGSILMVTLLHSGQSSSTLYHPACLPIMQPGFHFPPAHTLQGENQSCFICPEDRQWERQRRTSIIHGICGYVEWTAAANWAHFALTPASLRGEPITTFLLQNNRNSPIFPWARTQSESTKCNDPE